MQHSMYDSSSWTGVALITRMSKSLSVAIAADAKAIRSFFYFILLLRST